MKKSLWIWGIFSVLVFVFIYMFTLILTSQERSLLVFETLVEQARDEENFDLFVAYQSIAYEKIEIIDTTTYTFHIYQVISKDSDVYKNQFVLFVLPKQDVSFAESISDPNDLTKLIVRHQVSSDLIFDSSQDDIYQNQSISYGIGRIGFYYYTFFIDQSYEMDLELFDYEGELIYQGVLSLDYRAYSPTDVSWLIGMTKEEKDELLDLDTYLRPVMIRNITIYLIVDFVILGLILFFQKYKKR